MKTNFRVKYYKKKYVLLPYFEKKNRNSFKIKFIFTSFDKNFG